MTQSDVVARYRTNLQGEVDSAGLYRALADTEPDAHLSEVYRRLAAVEEEPTVYLTALRHVVEARGVARIAKTSGVPRESVYRALSDKGNPRWDTLAAILKAVGMRLVIASSAPQRHRFGKKTAPA